MLRERHTQTYCSKTALKLFSRSFPLRYGASAIMGMVCVKWFDWQTIRNNSLLACPFACSRGHPWIPPSSSCCPVSDRATLPCPQPISLRWCMWVSAFTFVHTSFCLCTWAASAKLCSSVPSVTQAPYASWCSRYLKWFLRKLCRVKTMRE